MFLFEQKQELHVLIGGYNAFVQRTVNVGYMQQLVLHKRYDAGICMLHTGDVRSLALKRYFMRAACKFHFNTNTNMIFVIFGELNVD